MQQQFKFDHLSVLNKNVANELNSYRNWGDVDLMIDPVPKEFIGENEDVSDYPPVPAKGTKSLFNNVHGVYYATGLRMRANMPLLDTQDIREQLREQSDCSIKTLVELSKQNKLGRSVYNYSDFMYCANLGRISNNYMITLRRFPAPCSDTITYINPDDENEIGVNSLQSHAPDVGRLITWLGVSNNEMSNILKYSYSMPFKEVTADLIDYTGPASDDKGLLATIMNASSKEYQQMQLAGMGGEQQNEYLKRVFSGNRLATKYFDNQNAQYRYSQAEWRSFRDRNKVYGPIDAIKKTTVRGDDGLQFNHSFTLTFDYQLRSYDGINTKSAFLDLLSNILAVTYTTGTFWGGAYRMIGGMPQSNVYANLPIFKNSLNGNIKSWGDLFDSTFDSSNEVWKSVTNGEGLLGLFDNLSSMAFSSFIGTAINKLGRPNKIAVQSLLDPIPTGMWHVTIGNPRHPILSMGNLILESTEIEHYGHLGLDDFPTGIRVTCTLKHGKPRDVSMIESMYVFGHSRVYVPVGNYILDMYKNSTQYNQAKEERFGRYTSSIGEVSSLPTNESNVEYANITNEERDEALYLYFGTKDKKIILPSANESAFGSQELKVNENANKVN